MLLRTYGLLRTHSTVPTWQVLFINGIGASSMLLEEELFCFVFCLFSHSRYKEKEKEGGGGGKSCRIQIGPWLNKKANTS